MRTLLAVIPHPDDESYSFGGTMALAAAAGWRCLVQCATSGERGKRHDGGPPGALHLAKTREAELAASCRILGAEPPVFWGLPDGGLRRHTGEARRLAALLQTLAPDVVLTLGPDGAYGHPDHVELNRWVTEAVMAAPRPPALLWPVFPPGLFLPQYERCIAMMGEPPSPAAEEIGSDAWEYEVAIAALRETKLAAIAAHRTQLPGGDPAAIFPPGIVAALLDVERFTAPFGAMTLPAPFGAPPRRQSSPSAAKPGEAVGG